MSYHIYTTEAILLKKADTGEADKIFSFYTKNFGRLEILAQGVRYLKSKLRYNLSGLAIIKIAFVETSSELMRLVGAEEFRTFGSLRLYSSRAGCAEGLLSLADRLLQGREKDEILWNMLVETFEFLDGGELIPTDLKNLETLTAYNLLRHLGYGGLEDLEKDRNLLSAAVRRGLELSQL